VRWKVSQVCKLVAAKIISTAEENNSQMSQLRFAQDDKGMWGTPAIGDGREPKCADLHRNLLPARQNHPWTRSK